jgi:hypothetical protein
LVQIPDVCRIENCVFVVVVVVVVLILLNGSSSWIWNRMRIFCQD